MNGRASLVEIPDQLVVGILIGVFGTWLVTTTFGGKVRKKAQTSLERKLGL
jgi:hypothetical protein